MTDATPNPGVYPGLSRAEYDGWALPSYSFLKLFLEETPAKIKWMREHGEDKTSKAMQEGDWIDALLYDRGRLETDFIRLPDDAPFSRPTSRQLNAKNPKPETVEAIAWWGMFDAAAGTKTPIKSALYDEAGAIVEAFYRHPVAKVIESAPHKQLAVVADDPETGIRFKVLLDTLAKYDGWSTGIDVKTVGDRAEASNFGRRGCNLHYPMQAFMYLHALNIIHPLDRRWLWIVMERTAPFQIATYYADDDVMSLGEHEFRTALSIYANCVASDHWPSYPIEPQPFELPGWKRKQLGF